MKFKKNKSHLKNTRKGIEWKSPKQYQTKRKNND